MKASVILAHPYPKSFNHAIYHQVIATLKARGIELFTHDLYRDKFAPVLTVGELGKKPTKNALVRRYSEELIQSDYLVFIHPNWWGQPPAILKGYIDRVIRPPHAYDFDESDSGGGVATGKLAGKVGIVFNTSNTDEERENGYFHDPLEYIWEKCVFGFCGITKTHRKMYRVIADSTEAERRGWLQDVDGLLKNALEYGEMRISGK